MNRLSNIKQNTDFTSGGKFDFSRKEKKVNVTIPLNPSTVQEVTSQITKKYRKKFKRTELMRYMIEFCVKSSQFEKLMEQL